MGIKTLDFKIVSSGFIFKSLKKSHIWTVEVDGEVIIVEFVTSQFSRNRKVILDNQILFEGVKRDEFSFSFYRINHILTITENSDFVDLHIDGQPFSVISKRHAGSFVQCSDLDDHLSPMILTDYSTVPEKDREPNDWEKKAKNFNKTPRNFPSGLSREKLKIKTFSASPYKVLSLEPSPRSTQVSIPSPLSHSLAHAARSRRKKSKKRMNFFF